MKFELHTYESLAKKALPCELAGNSRHRRNWSCGRTNFPNQPCWATATRYFGSTLTAALYGTTVRRYDQ